MLSRVLFTFHVLVIVSALIEAQEEKNVRDSIINMNDEQKEQYLNQDFNIHTYNYGYNVRMHNQFHHQMQGSDGITYGCYGYTNPHGNLTAIFYVSDGWGYRVVHPKEDVKLYNYNVKYSHQLYNRHNHDQQHHFHHRGVLTSWKDLHFPLSCEEFEGYSTHAERITNGSDDDDLNDSEDDIIDGSDGLSGPWPTGSPGPNGPWPGDPDYVHKTQ